MVNITTTTLRQDFFFDVVPQRGMGSGAIIGADGTIVTNFHVVGQAAKVEVTLQDKSSLPAKVIGVDPDSDLAVIKIDVKGRKLVPIDMGIGKNLAVGQKVLAIGNPFGLGGSLSTGIISSLGRDIRGTTDRLIKDIIQTDAAINPGNSGGPLLDSSGRLIGINTQIVSPSGASAGVGFAISVDTVRKVVPQLVQYGEVLRPDLAMEAVGLSAGLLQALGIPLDHGVMITDLDPRGLAAKAGLKPASREVLLGFRRIPYGGDLIFKVDNTDVSTFREILDYISEKKVGDVVAFHYLRGQVRKKADIKLALPASAKGKSL